LAAEITASSSAFGDLYPPSIVAIECTTDTPRRPLIPHCSRAHVAFFGVPVRAAAGFGRGRQTTSMSTLRRRDSHQQRFGERYAAILTVLIQLMAGGKLAVVTLCQGSTHRLKNPILFDSPRQTLSTEGNPKGRERALLVVEGKDQAVAIKSVTSFHVVDERAHIPGRTVGSVRARRYGHLSSMEIDLSCCEYRKVEG